VFPGVVDRDALGLGERLIVKMIGAPDGDFGPWDGIDAFAREIGDAPLARQTGEGRPAEHEMDRQRLPAIGSSVGARVTPIAGVLGPLVTGMIRFRLPDAAVNQYVGGEIVTMFIAAPALIAAGVLWLRNHRLAPVIAIGPAAYTVYTFITAIVGQEYGRYDGNVENAFFLYAGLVLGGWLLVVLAGLDLLMANVPTMPDGLRNVTAGVFLVIAAFFALAWVGQIAQVYGGERSDAYLESPTLFWLIKLMDLGFLLPLFATTGVAMLRGQRLATTLAYGMVSYAVCMAAAVLGMAI